MNPKITKALMLARPLLLDSKELLVEGACRLDDQLRPRLETMDPEMEPTIQQYDDALAAIDAALNLLGEPT